MQNEPYDNNFRNNYKNDRWEEKDRYACVSATGSPCPKDDTNANSPATSSTGSGTVEDL